jgi:hypothetical protein
LSQQSLLLLVADAILIVHVLFVGFVVLGLTAIYLGLLLRWSWVRNIWFRVLHLAGIGIVVLQSWLGVICPLTTWEMVVREKAGAETYSGSLIQHWLQSILYYSAPEWVFIVCYTVFGGFALASWFIVRPN